MDPERDYTPHLVSIRNLLRAILIAILVNTGIQAPSGTPGGITLFVAVILLLVWFVRWLLGKA